MKNREFELFEMKPKKRVGVGYLAVSMCNAQFFIDAKPVAIMNRITIDTAGSAGILLTGFEDIGTDKKGIRKLKYQEWWLAYQ